MRSKVTSGLIVVIVVALAAGVINYQGLVAKNPRLAPKLGLDLSGGVRIVLEAEDTATVQATNDAIDAAVGIGLHPDFNTAVREMTRVSRTFEPDAKTHKIYDELYEKVYLKMYDRLKPLYRTMQRKQGAS